MFSLLIADLEEKMRRREKGGIEIEGRKLYTLSYADNEVLMAKEGEGLRLTIKELKGYLKEKGLEVNPRKSKVMRFGKRLRKLRKVEAWKWEGEVVEVVREFEYLGFLFQCNGGVEGHIRKSEKGGGSNESCVRNR